MDEADVLADETGTDALDALLLDYGQAYKIEVTDGEWRWRRLDGLGSWATAVDPDELQRQVREDFTLKPVAAWRLGPSS